MLYAFVLICYFIQKVFLIIIVLHRSWLSDGLLITSIINDTLNIILFNNEWQAAAECWRTRFSMPNFMSVCWNQWLCMVLLCGWILSLLAIEHGLRKIQRVSGNQVEGTVRCPGRRQLSWQTIHLSGYRQKCSPEYIHSAQASGRAYPSMYGIQREE